MEELAKIEKPVVVVGMYRTSKNFLLNRLMNRTDGFPLGATVEAKTKGIWMWVGDVPYDPTRAVVLLDTKGLHDPEKEEETGEDFAKFFPTLIWAVRDHHLELNVDG